MFHTHTHELQRDGLMFCWVCSQAWVVESSYAIYDLDNLRLEDVGSASGAQAVFKLESILLMGTLLFQVRQMSVYLAGKSSMQVAARTKYPKSRLAEHSSCCQAPAQRGAIPWAQSSCPILATSNCEAYQAFTTWSWLQDARATFIR